MAQRTRRPKAQTYVQPREPFTGDMDGVPFVLNPSDILLEDDPVVRKYPDHFKPLTPSRQRPAVEQATAAPGEKRGART